MGKKLGSNKCLLFTMLTKQKFLNVSHNKLVKKTKGLLGLLSDPFIQGLRFLKENSLIILGDLLFFEEKRSIFTSDLPTHSH
jgi:hypothetical protein